jgi:hypothetical protein
MACVDELLTLETDGSCAVCGMRDRRVLTVHHIEQVEPKNEAYDNKLLLCHNCHQSYHQGKGVSAEDLRAIKRLLIIKTITRQGLNALKEAQRRGCVVATPFLVNHLVERGYLAFGGTLSSWRSSSEDGETIIDAVYTISDEGKQLLERWQLK